MKKLGDIIKSLAEKAGLKSDDETLKKILGISEISTVELPDEFSNALEQNLLTEQSAIANTKVRSKLFAEALNGVDAELDGLMGDFEFDDTFKTQYKSIEKNTNEKVRQLKSGLQAQLKAAKEQAKKTGDPNDKAAVTALQNQIAELNKNTEDLKRLHAVELDNLKKQNLNDRKQFTLRSILAGKPLPKNGLSADINILTAKTLLEQEMAKHGLQILFDENGSPILKQRKEGADIDYFVDNKKVDVSAFIDGVLAQNKFLQINDSDQATNAGGNNQQQFNHNTSTPTNAQVVQETQELLSQIGATV